uniref:HTH La-type RNA-binding domain-containing protein n=1 Tax=Opuntia streptacantha TaxID=393608 RepID=A0A7C9CIN5_OPUST
MKKDKAGFVSISLIGSFTKMKKITKDVSLIAEALKESSQLLVSSDGMKVKRLHPLPLSETKDPKSCTVVVENLPEDRSIENIRKSFGQVGRIKSITIHDPLAAEDAEQSNKGDKLISGKVASLNDETDWRNGLRVQLLKRRMGYCLGRRARKGPDSEKGSHDLVPVGDENTNQPNQQHGEADGEEGDHTSKERNGHRGRNRSKGRKHHGNNGMGHGTSPVEISKPPPGPRMPDGTRGFTLGRGRPGVFRGV